MAVVSRPLYRVRVVACVRRQDGTLEWFRRDCDTDHQWAARIAFAMKTSGNCRYGPYLVRLPSRAVCGRVFDDGAYGAQECTRVAGHDGRCRVRRAADRFPAAR